MSVFVIVTAEKSVRFLHYSSPNIYTYRYTHTKLLDDPNTYICTYIVHTNVDLTFAEASISHKITGFAYKTFEMASLFDKFC